MATPDLASQVNQYYQQQLQQLQSQYNGAMANSDVGSWGGSDADRQHWLSVANSASAGMDTMKGQLQNVLGAVNSGAVDASQMGVIQKALSGDSVAMEQLNEAVSGKKQLDTQNQQLADFQKGLIQQNFGTDSLQNLNLGQALTSTAGSIGQLNNFLGQQEGQTFNQQLKPVIQMALGSQGLSDSGAQVEVQSRALAQLEQQRQQSMMQAALGAQSQIQGVQRSDLLGGIGLAQQNMNNQFDLSRTGITMQFQQQLENQREQLARELSKYGGGGSGLGGVLGGGIGAALGGVAGGIMTGGNPMGIMGGAGLGMSLGGGIGNAVNPNSNYSAMSGMGPALMNSATFFQTPKTQPVNPSTYAGPMNNNGYAWNMTGPSY